MLWYQQTEKQVIRLFQSSKVLLILQFAAKKSSLPMNPSRAEPRSLGVDV